MRRRRALVVALVAAGLIATGCALVPPSTPATTASAAIKLVPVQRVPDADLMVAADRLVERLAALGVEAEATAMSGGIEIFAPADPGLRIPAALLEVGRLSIAVVPPDVIPEAGEPAPWLDFVGPHEFAPVLAAVGTDTSGVRTVDLGLTPVAAGKLAQFTEANIGRHIAVVVDRTVVSAPTIMSAIPDGRIQILLVGPEATALERAQAIAGYARSGPLPVRFVQVE